MLFCNPARVPGTVEGARPMMVVGTGTGSVVLCHEV